MSENEKDIAEIAELVSRRVARIPIPDKTFSLAQPANLTVVLNGGQYSRRNHIGGEDFHIHEVYLGKRGDLIYKFRPNGASSYILMEMREQEAIKQLLGFGEFASKLYQDETLRELIEARDRASLDRERAQLATREEYKEMGFASWA